MENRPGQYRPESEKPKSTDPPKPHQEGGNGSPGIPPTLHERAKPPPREIDKQLARARRLDYRQACQRRLPERSNPVEDPTLHQATLIVISKEYKDRKERDEAHLTAQEREDSRVLGEIDYLKESRTMTKKINYAQHLQSELLDKMQRFDPEFMTPIYEGLKKRPARQAKAERAIQRRGITPGTDDYAPLWER